MILWLLGAAALIVALLGAARLVFRPPPLIGRPRSHALPASDATRLGRVVDDAIGAGDSAVSPLLAGRHAFAARVALLRAAEQSVDIQYYIWQRDATGLMLLGEVQRAAERGVRVRMLIDDHGSPALDRDLRALDDHPMVEVRLFNPFILRRGRLVSFLFDFARLNRRMHNKSLTVDGAATIVGGRNIGDIYFAYGDGTHYIDTDVLCLGRIAADVARDFDRYWACGSSHPASRILSPAAGAWQALAEASADCARTEVGAAYLTDLDKAAPRVAALLTGRSGFTEAPVTLISDPPAKGLGRARPNQLLFHRLVALIGQPAQSLDVISSYFVPGRNFTRALTALARRGRRVRVLTNSQQATDVLVVHSAYVRYRPKLLDAGVRLYELKADAPPASPPAEREVKRRTVVGSSRSSLHSKSLIVDEQRVFIGSFNFDHRSLDLNTEMGVVVDSAPFAAEVSESFRHSAAQHSYRPRRDASGALVWDDPGPPPTVHHEEPKTSWLSRAVLRCLGWMPIEWLL